MLTTLGRVVGLYIPYCRGLHRNTPWILPAVVVANLVCIIMQYIVCIGSTYFDHVRFVVYGL